MPDRPLFWSFAVGVGLALGLALGSAAADAIGALAKRAVEAPTSSTAARVYRA